MARGVFSAYYMRPHQRESGPILTAGTNLVPVRWVYGDGSGVRCGSATKRYFRHQKKYDQDGKLQSNIAELRKIEWACGMG